MKGILFTYLVLLFIVSTAVSAQTISTRVPNDVNLCAGTHIEYFFFDYIGPFTSSNQFTCQLSDSSGSFSNATIVGGAANLDTMNGPGSISITIPNNTPFGRHYRLRVVSSSPIIAGAADTLNLTINPTPAVPIITTSGTNCLGNDTLHLLDAAKGTMINWFQTDTLVSADTAIAYILVGTIAGGNGQGTALNQFARPFGIQLDDSGYLYVADEYNNRVVRFPPHSDSTTMGTVVAGGNGQGSAANQLYSPRSIFVDHDGTLYVPDPGNYRVQKFAAGSSTGVTVAGGNGHGSNLNQILEPSSVWVDSAGNLFVADAQSSRVVKFPPNSTSATYGVIVAGGNGLGNGPTQLKTPMAIFFDRYGNLFVADGANYRVQLFPPNSTSATPAITVAGGTQGAGPAQLSPSVFDLFVDTAGYVYTADYPTGQVKKFPTGGNPGTHGATIAGHFVGSGSLVTPTSIWLDDTGNLFASDDVNHRVQKWSPPKLDTHYIPSVAGSYKASYISEFGCPSPISDSVIVHPFLTPSVRIIASQANMCAGTADTFNAVGINGGTNTIYSWYKNGVPVGSNTNFYSTTPINNDTVWVMLTSNDFCLTDTMVTSNSIALTVNPVPAPVITRLSNDTLATDTYSSYQWFVNDTAINNGMTSSIIPQRDGIYSVFVTDSNGCNAWSDTVVISKHTAIGTLLNHESTKVFPNPSAGIFYFKAIESGCKVEVFNAFGTNVYSVCSVTDNCTVNLINAAKGIYFYRIINKDTTVQQGKIIIE